MYETIDDDFLICPYCGYKEKVDFETFYSNFGNDPDCSEDHECCKCGRTFMAHRVVLVHYETDKIESKSLMIGDWVKSRTGMNVRIDGISHDYPSEYEPIPLTPEILEKNGIKFQYGRPWYQWHNDKIQIVCDEVRLCVDYVHTLQHALRLCGLNELADNFKID